MMFTLLATATWGALAAVFGAMWFTGTVAVCEDNSSVRVVEMAIFSALFLWGLGKYYKKGGK